MKLDQFIPKTPTAKQLNKVIESRFGFSINYNNITLRKAETMRGKIMETVNSIRKSSAVHTAEQDPQYLEMLIVYEGLSRWVDAYKLQESRKLQEQRRKIYEGELGQAEVMLAAKDMVDSVQDMIEKVGKMQNEQLPALIDSIRDQIGAVEGDTFKISVGQLLGTLLQQLSQARDQLDNSTRTLSGEGETAPMGMPGDAQTADIATDGDVATAEEPSADMATSEDPSMGAPVGRERR
jgi:hypothetical protein